MKILDGIGLTKAAKEAVDQSLAVWGQWSDNADDFDDFDNFSEAKRR
jgi:hypothetical protein